MPTMTPIDPALADEIIARWLSDAPGENPAGDLFVSGEYAVQEITMTISPPGSRCSSCTGSRPIQCC